ncbi:hypothetical protein ACFX2F_016922 [Malus domestica]
MPDWYAENFTIPALVLPMAKGSFSSREPDPITPSILKPDILAPGVDVLTAVAPNKRFMEVNNYNLVSDYQHQWQHPCCRSCSSPKGCSQ